MFFYYKGIIELRKIVEHRGEHYDTITVGTYHYVFARSQGM